MRTGRNLDDENRSNSLPKMHGSQKEIFPALEMIRKSVKNNFWAREDESWGEHILGSIGVFEKGLNVA